MTAHRAYLADIAICDADHALIWANYVDLYETGEATPRNAAERHARKARTEASYSKSDRSRHGIGRGKGYAKITKRLAARSDRRLARAICREAI